MSIKAIIPTGPEIAREALILAGGALLFAMLLSLPVAAPFKKFIRDAWAADPGPNHPFP